MEDGDAAERTADPFTVVLFELGVHGLQEGADEGHLPGRTDNRAFAPDVAD